MYNIYIIQFQICEDDVHETVNNLLENILNSSCFEDDTYTAVAHMLYEILSQLPSNILLQEKNMNLIIQRVSNTNLNIDKRSLTELIKSVDSAEKNVDDIVKFIIQKVYEKNGE